MARDTRHGSGNNGHGAVDRDRLRKEIHFPGAHATAGGTSWTGEAEVERLVARRAYRPALERLIHSYQHLIVRYCVAMLGDTGHGEEIAQEVFLGAYAALPRFRREASVRTWLLAIARKQCLKALRDRRRRRYMEEAQRQEIAHGAHRAPPDPSAEDPEALRQRVRQGLERLRPAERTVLLLRYETGLTLAEVAHVVGRSEASVRRQLARALAQLRAVLEASL
jgi:RNA polymerase sigma-70 factor, ECF subfamily